MSGRFIPLLFAAGVISLGILSAGRPRACLLPQRAPAALTANPPTEKANGDYGGYFTMDEMRAKIAGWKTAHPGLVQVSSLGRTLEGRDIPLLRVGKRGDAPEILLLVGIHPREQQPQVCLVRLLDEMLGGYNKDPRLTKILDTRTLWIVPVFNVDGKVYDMAHGNGSNKGADWRKNRRVNADGTFGVDLNRNFPVRWGGSREIDPTWKTTTTNTAGNIYEGPAPLSEPENQQLVRFIESRPKLRAFLDLHSPLRAFYFPSHLIQPEFDRLTGMIEAMRASQKSPYPMTAAIPDDEPRAGVRGGNSGLTYTWAYYTRGIFAFNFEIGLPSRYPAVAEIDAEYAANVREPLLIFFEKGGELPLPTIGPDAKTIDGTLSGPLKPGATVNWTPKTAIDGYGVLVSGRPEIVIPSEYRILPAKTGFTIEVSKEAKTGTRVPMTLYQWNTRRTRTAAPFTLTVE